MMLGGPGQWDGGHSISLEHETLAGNEGVVLSGPL
jgi:hypothetical protein